MIELFHATNDEGSAEARKLVVDRGLVDKIRFRNIFYPEVQADLDARGGRRRRRSGTATKLIEGRDAVLAFLAALYITTRRASTPRSCQRGRSRDR